MPTIDVGITEGDILDEIAREFSASRPVRKPGGVTASELAAKMGTSHNTAKAWLDGKCASGEYEREVCLINGKRAAVYYRLA